MRLLNTRCSALHVPRRCLFVTQPLSLCAGPERRKRGGGGGPDLGARGFSEWPRLGPLGSCCPAWPCRCHGARQVAAHNQREAGPSRPGSGDSPPAEPGRFPPGRALAAGPGPGASPPARPRRCPGAKAGLSPPTPPRSGGVSWFLLCAGVGICSEINKYKIIKSPFSGVWCAGRIQLKYWSGLHDGESLRNHFQTRQK